MKKISAVQLKNLSGSVSLLNVGAASVGWGVGLWACAHAFVYLANKYPYYAAHRRGFLEGYALAPVNTIIIEKSFSDGFSAGQLSALHDQRRRAQQTPAETTATMLEPSAPPLFADQSEIPIAYPVY